MLNNYGTEYINRDGVLEGGMTFGAHWRALGDWLGLDGEFGIQGDRDDEGSAAASNGAGGASGDIGTKVVINDMPKTHTGPRGNDDDGPKGQQSGSIGGTKPRFTGGPIDRTNRSHPRT